MTDSSSTTAAGTAASSSFDWPPLESNPEIFERYMAGLGLPTTSWGFSEVYGFDEDMLAFVPQPAVAVIVNMERLQKEQDKLRGADATTATATTGNDKSKRGLFYMKQTKTLDNACGVIACLHGIYNNLGLIALEEGKTLSNYWERVKDKTPEERASILEGFTEFQEQHKAFASQGQSNLAQNQADVKHHYVAFVMNDCNQLLELDGTKQGPYVVEENCQDVLRGSVAAIQKRLQAGEISESLSMMVLNMK